MRLRPVSRPDAAEAAALLAEGFPTHSREAWAACLADILDHAEGMGHDAIGQFASVDGGDIGIGLTIPSRPVAYARAPRDVVNLSAFYMRPGNEWRTPLFIRRVMTDPAIDYVDLTASESMRQLNRRLGLVDRSSGAVVIPLALSALRPSRGAKVVSPEAISPSMMSDVHRGLLRDHARLGCIAVGIALDGACHPLILGPSRRRDVAGVRVILVRDRALLRAALGPVSRFLLKRGLYFLEFEGVDKAGFPEALFRPTASPLQTTHEPDSAVIDHTYTEYAFIPPPRDARRRR